MFDFPSSPTEGQTFTPPGGPTYIWKSPVWMQQTKPIATAQARNRIVNGAFQISQENGDTAGTSAPYYAADQWAMAQAGGAGVHSAQRAQSVTPAGAADRFRITVTTGATMVNNTRVETKVEGLMMADLQWGTAAARQVILRFGFKAPAGTYSVALRNNGLNRAYVVNFTISAAQANADTLQTFVIPGDTTGLWQKDASLGVYISVAIASAAASVTGTLSAWHAGNFIAGTGIAAATTTGQVFELFDVGLYSDPDLTGLAPKFEVPDYGEELRACQRYYYRFPGSNNATGGNRYGAAGMAVSDAGTFTYHVTMRASPTLSHDAIGYTNASAGAWLGSHFGATLRATVTAAGQYRASISDFVANARM